MMSSSPICLLSKASKTKSWLWHRRLSHLNFGAINHLARHGLVRGLPKLKFEKDHLCSACALGKSSKKPHKPKSEDTNQEKLYLLHMDPVVANAFRKCQLKRIRLKETVRRIRTDNGTEFVNQTLREYYEKVGISHETSVARSPQQNDVVERRNRTLIEAARTMLIYAKAPFNSMVPQQLPGQPCYTQNRSMIRRRHARFGHFTIEADIGIFIGYAHEESIPDLQQTSYEHGRPIKMDVEDYVSESSTLGIDNVTSFLISNDFSKGSVDPTLFICKKRQGTTTEILAFESVRPSGYSHVEKSKLERYKKGKLLDLHTNPCLLDEDHNIPSMAFGFKNPNVSIFCLLELASFDLAVLNLSGALFITWEETISS
ncbi:retrovirus-related pol polyprotein from transposon TNT 1-94 [Tanacetum coccineum]|uniref:Retrovirus-related pol polyprotein from transposon TNT 1-94 n=1 Tax=Tanacetum coccineum TaxID=301880 RepID=A0ABQ5HKN0_9ASTR